MEDWAYPYIQGCVEQGFFAGSEEGTFRPQADLTLWEAQALMDRLAPDYNSRIVLTAENKNMAVSYELWVQLLETALKAREEKRDLLVSRRAEIVQTAESLAQIEKKEAKAANQRAEAEKKALAVAEKEEKLKILKEKMGVDV